MIMAFIGSGGYLAGGILLEKGKEMRISEGELNQKQAKLELLNQKKEKLSHIIAAKKKVKKIESCISGIEDGKKADDLLLDL